MNYSYYLEILGTFFDEFDRICSSNFEKIGDLEYYSKKNLNFLVKSGISRVCLIPKEDSRFVLKFNKPNKASFDYCAQEQRLYREAKLRRIEDLFLPLRGFSFKNIMMAYLQRKVDKLGEDLPVRGFSERFLNSRAANTSFYKYSKDDMGQLIEKIYEKDPEKCAAFVSFYEEGYLEDIHSENWGVMDGNPVVFDYAGIFEKEL